MYKVAIVGTGAIAGLHGEVLKKQGVEISKVYDIKKEKANNFARKYLSTKEVCNSLEEVIEDKNTIVAVLTPPNTHYTILTNLIKNGAKNIFCEKPLVLEENHLSEIEKLVASTKTNIMIGQSYRFFDHIEKLREETKKNNEKLKFFKIEYRKPIEKIHPIDGWRAKCRDYIVIENGVHILDLVRYIFRQEITSMQTMSSNISGKISGSDVSTLNVRLDSGAIGNIILNHNEQEKPTLYCGEHEYYFDRSTMRLNCNKIYTYNRSTNEVKLIALVKEDWQKAFGKMWMEFFKSIKKKNPPINIKDNAKTLRALFSVLNSTKE